MLARSATQRSVVCPTQQAIYPRYTLVGIVFKSLKLVKSVFVYLSAFDVKSITPCFQVERIDKVAPHLVSFGSD